MPLVEAELPEPVLSDGARRRLARLTEAAGGLWLSAGGAAPGAEVGPASGAASGWASGAWAGSGDGAAPVTASVPVSGAGAASLTAAGGASGAASAGISPGFRAGALWTAAVPAGVVAHPVLPGAPGASVRAGPGGRRALALSPGQNGGYAPGMTIHDPALWTAAVIYAPGPAPARTLVALRGDDRQKNYVFLSEDEPGQLVLRDNAEAVRITLTLPPGLGGWCPVVVSAAAGRLSLAVPGGLRATQTGLADLPASAGLLLGCRAARAGMPKSLGAALISDLLVWPGQDLLAPGDPSGLLAAFDAFCLWEL